MANTQYVLQQIKNMYSTLERKFSLFIAKKF